MAIEERVGLALLRHLGRLAFRVICTLVDGGEIFVLRQALHNFLLLTWRAKEALLNLLEGHSDLLQLALHVVPFIDQLIEHSLVLTRLVYKLLRLRAETQVLHLVFLLGSDASLLRQDSCLRHFEVSQLILDVAQSLNFGFALQTPRLQLGFTRGLVRELVVGEVLHAGIHLFLDLLQQAQVPLFGRFCDHNGVISLLFGLFLFFLFMLGRILADTLERTVLAGLTKAVTHGRHLLLPYLLQPFVFLLDLLLAQAIRTALMHYLDCAVRELVNDLCKARVQRLVGEVECELRLLLLRR